MENWSIGALRAIGVKVDKPEVDSCVVDLPALREPVAGAMRFAAGKSATGAPLGLVYDIQSTALRGNFKNAFVVE